MDMSYILDGVKNAKSCLVLIDEFGWSKTGVDAFSFAWSYCEVLKDTSAFTMFATHFDLSMLARLCPSIVLRRFKMQREEHRIKYDYKLYAENERAVESNSNSKNA